MNKIVTFTESSLEQPDRLAIAVRAFATRSLPPDDEGPKKKRQGELAPASEWTLIFDTETTGNEVIDEFNRVLGKGITNGKTQFPLALSLSSGILTSDGGTTASLIVGDYSSSSLTIVDYDPNFGTMDIVATVPIGIRIDQKSMIQVDPLTKLVKQPLVIGGDDKQGTILVGSGYSTQLVQFSRGVSGTALERVREIEIPGPPTSISVSSDGESAVVAIAHSPELPILTVSEHATVLDDQATKIRQLQRELSELDLDVGSIDGVVGQATLTAVNIFNTFVGSKISVSDIDSAIKIVRAFNQKCPSSGSQCLLDSARSLRQAQATGTHQNTESTTSIFKVCSGEYERACQPHDAYLYCGADVGAWAKVRCNSYRVTRLSTSGGNKCGYSIDAVTCIDPK
jgi:hypothetical protein